MTVFAKVQIDEQSFRQAEGFLSTVELEMRTGILPKAMRAAAAPVEKTARRLAPDSVKSGSRAKWSKKVKQQRTSTKQHKETIGHSSVRTYRDALAIYVGPLYPAGNLINAIGHPHKQVLWGRSTGVTLPPTEYLEKAAEQTASEQQSAFVSKVKSETEKILKKAP